MKMKNEYGDDIPTDWDDDDGAAATAACVLHTPSIINHSSWVEAWTEAVETASGSYPAPLSESQRQVYLLIPDLLDRCRESFEAIPEHLRPVHYLSVLHTQTRSVFHKQTRPSHV